MSEEEYTGNPEHRIPGMISWNELSSINAAESRDFYVGLFDWEVEEMPMGDTNYTMFRVGKVPVAGVVQPPDFDSPCSVWTNYVTVENIEASLQKAESLGAKIIMGATPLPEGRFAMITDPHGAAIGLYEYGEKSELQ